MTARFGPAGVAGVLILLALGACGRFERISEQGGLFGRAPSKGNAPQNPGGPAEPDCIPQEVLEAARNDYPPQPEILGPYQPSDFQKHGAEKEFAWHWTATRLGDRVEVKGLVHNRGKSAVQGVTFVLTGPDARARADSPGLIRPNRMRPFYFSAPFPGDELQAQLSVARVDRRVVASLATGLPPGAKPCPQPAAARGPAKPLPQQSDDHFFSLQWTTRNTGDEVEISGLVENRDGPTMREVTLIVHAYDADGKTLKTERMVFPGIFEKKEVRPFTVSLRPGKEPERISVAVERYQFDVRGF